ncbi:2'-5' RNA ligase family protein [Micromonospora sp. NPDC050495]|uniref:2'-5' RNA ligase family protein n=1 Tax=Micromonospora sp. NPDC050495 TaxID=3154936 RepID=UPI0034065F67
MRLFVAVYPPRPAVDDLTAQVARLRIGAASAAGTNVRLADPAHAHLTLAFLGDVEESRLVDVESALGLAAETYRNGLDGLDGRDGLDGQDGEGGLDGLDGLDGQGGQDGEDGPDGEGGLDGLDGRDGRNDGDRRDGSLRLRLSGGGSFGRGRFTVLWVDVRGDIDGLATLARLIRIGLRRARLPYDEKPFRAHLTIARPGDRVDRAEILADREALHDYAGPEWTADELVLVRSHPGPKPTYDRLAAWPI